MNSAEDGVLVANVEELNEPKLVEIDGKKYLVCRVDGEVRAYRNVCPHQYGPVAEGRIEGTTVFCPWHGWGFDLETGDDLFGGLEGALPQVRTTVDRGEVRLHVSSSTS